MHAQSCLFRLTATVAIAAILGNALLPATAAAQPAVPSGADRGPDKSADQTQDDPPARVGRIASTFGSVSFRTAADTQWAPAGVNYPVSSGNAFWADGHSRARLEISGNRVALAPLTEFDVTMLDAAGLQGSVPQGEVYLNLRDLTPNEAWTLQTPRGVVRLAQPGRYGIVIGSTEAPTQLTVLDGSAQIEGPGVTLTVASNETATVSGIDSFEGSVGPAVRDPFLTEQLEAERPRAQGAALPPSVATQVAQMPGGSDLYETGRWAEAPDYGQVWYPPVQAGWTPYRDGRWAYVSPWGWTWIDDAPWGFAPFHYGRWVDTTGRWAWTPGGIVVSGPAVYTPVYAPALVAFVGIGAGATLGAAFPPGSVGWIPLGPREPYHPWYRASNGYFQRLNGAHVTNVASLRSTTVNNVTGNNYINRAAATVVPASVMTGSRPVHPAAQRFAPDQFAAVRPIIGQAPVLPGPNTAGLTPAVARRLNLAPAVPGSLRSAPGPMGRSQTIAAGVGGVPSRPVLLPMQGGLPVPAANVAEPHLPGRPSPGAMGQPFNRTSLPASVPQAAGGQAPGAPGPMFDRGTLPNGLPAGPGGNAPGAPGQPFNRATLPNGLPLREGGRFPSAAAQVPFSRSSVPNQSLGAPGQPPVSNQTLRPAAAPGVAPVGAGQVPGGANPMLTRTGAASVPSTASGQPVGAPNQPTNHVLSPNGRFGGAIPPPSGFDQPGRTAAQTLPPAGGGQPPGGASEPFGRTAGPNFAPAGGSLPPRGAGQPFNQPHVAVPQMPQAPAQPRIAIPSSPRASPRASPPPSGQVSPQPQHVAAPRQPQHFEPSQPVQQQAFHPTQPLQPRIHAAPPPQSHPQQQQRDRRSGG